MTIYKPFSHVIEKCINLDFISIKPHFYDPIVWNVEDVLFEVERVVQHSLIVRPYNKTLHSLSRWIGGISHGRIKSKQQY